MKKYIYMLGIAACMSAACTNLDETIYSQLPKEEFFKSEAQLTTYSARPYTLLQNWGTEQSMWTLIMQLSNEVAVPKSYNGSWSEPRYREIQTHKMQTNNKLMQLNMLQLEELMLHLLHLPFQFSNNNMQYKRKLQQVLLVNLNNN